MRCRHFTLRLSAQHAPEDEARLNEFLQGVKVHTIQTFAGAPGSRSILVFYEESPPERAERGSQSDVVSAASAPLTITPALTEEEQRIYERLREWRSKRAADEGKPAYIIAHNAVLLHIARHHMSIRAAEDLLAISQFGPARTARYGPDILQLLCLLGERDGRPLFEDEP